MSIRIQSTEQLYSYFLECNQEFTSDTRKLKPNALFIALKGENFNGNNYANFAIENGCKYALVDEIISDNDQLLLVDNVLIAFQDLATHHRSVSKAKILGIGGSNGKTTTKELLFSVLNTEYKCQCTQGNLNNHIGVPMTLLSLKSDTEIMIVELGANKAGDIDELCIIALPDLGIITNIGKEHLMGFGDIEGVAKAESELFDYLNKSNGFSFVNEDDFWLNNMSKRLSKYKKYNINQLETVHVVPDIAIKYKDVTIQSILMGEHNLQNIVAVISIAEHFGIKPDNIKKGIESYSPKNNRSQWIKTEKNNQVLLDAYNANPSSVLAALKTFNLMKGDKIVLLGDMYELGEHEVNEHLQIINECLSLDFNQVYFIGEIFKKASIGQNNFSFFATKELALVELRNQKIKENLILIKGSRGMKMEDFVVEF